MAAAKIVGAVTVLGGKHHRHKARHYDCIGIDPLVLSEFSLLPRNYILTLHLLKLVTGVDISTRPVNKSGRPGKEVKSKSRTAAAAPNMAPFLRSMFIMKVQCSKSRNSPRYHPSPSLRFSASHSS